MRNAGRKRKPVCTAFCAKLRGRQGCQETLAQYEASATHQEILKGLGTTTEERRHVFVFCRNVPDEDCDPDLVSLKKLLRENIHTYQPGELRNLCEDVERKLRAVIERGLVWGIRG